MSVVDPYAGTRIDEIADRIYRISTPVPPSEIPGGFTFNQYLVEDDEPLLFHTGPRRLVRPVVEAIETVLPVARLRYIGCSHIEADECGALNELLARAERARPVSGTVAVRVSLEDMADRRPIALEDGASLRLGRHEVRWIDAPHMPHAWECGYLMETSTATLLCGDLFTQPGADRPALTTDDILEPSETFREAFDYYSHTIHAERILHRLAALEPRTLACMHGSAWEGRGDELLRELARRLAP